MDIEQKEMIRVLASECIETTKALNDGLLSILVDSYKEKDLPTYHALRDSSDGLTVLIGLLEEIENAD